MTDMEALNNFIWEHVLAYGTFAALGVVAAFVCALLLCFRLRQNWVRQVPMMLCSLVGMGIGAKLFGMVSYESYLRAMGAEVSLKILFNNSGIVFYGGLLGYFGMLALLFWKLLPKKRLGWDIVAVSTPLFHGIARVGCYFAHETVDGELVWHPCCYGMRMDNAFCSLFWDSRLPTQLIEAAFNLALFCVLLALLLTNKKEERRGNLIGLYLIAYSLFRFIIEFFRGDEVRGGYGPFAFSQVVSLAILLGVAVFLVLKRAGVIPPAPVDPYDPEVEKYALFTPAGEPIEFAEPEKKSDD
ncbi:MAG: prolipoprotein diacylglyceryl transferase [Clostridia bacterium]|nr:prolipoprotein diacylglyceryl transferase [Clostridia bacterium]